MSIVLASALLSTAASAFDLKIYGVGHVSIDRTDNGMENDAFVASNSSRLGVRGEHTLGDDLSVVVQYESGVDLTGRGENDGNGGGPSDGRLFTRARDSFVGVSSRFGSLRLGRLGGLNQWVYDINLFADQVGDLGNIWGGTGLSGRVDSALQYTTADLGGLGATLTYAPKGGAGDTDVFVAKATYSTAAVQLGGAYMSQGAGGATDHTAFAITGVYRAGRFTIGAGYQNESDIAAITGNDRDGITLGGSVKFRKGLIKAQVTTSDGDLRDSRATQWAVGYDYHLGKNTTAYIAYARTDNNRNASFSATDYGHGDNVGAGARGDDPSVMSIGLTYSFESTRKGIGNR